MTVTGVSSDVGTIVEVRVETLGDELAAAVAAGAATLTVVDAVDFDEDGGSLAIGTEVLGYTGVDDETGVITLDPATPLVGSYPVEERVELSPASLVKTAQVMVGDFDEAVEAVVPHTLWDRIAEGIRADGSGEVVTLELVDDEFVIADVAGEPVIDGSLLDPSIPLPPELATSGPQGIPGPPGADGQPLYTWLKYADSPTTGMSDLPAGKTYMGLAYNKTTPIESGVYADYAWSLIQGPQGDTGVEGPAGADGTPRYTWIKYGDSAAGVGLSDSPVGKTYIGIAYNKTTASESAVASDYEWSLIQGPQGPPGASAATVVLTATSQVLAVPAAGGATTPATSTVTGAALNTTISVWQYSVDGAAFSATVPAGVSRVGNVVTITGATMTARTIAVRMADANGVADTLTVAKVSDGATGATGGTGGTGAAGADAYTVLLTNEAQVFPGSTTAALAGSATSQVLAYKGSVQQTASIGTITGQVTGLTTSVQNNGTTTAGFTVTVTTALTTTSGTLTVPITVDGQTFTKKFSWSLSLTGATGSTGPQGNPGQDLAASDGLAPLGSPTPTVYGAFGALAVTFTPLTVPGTRSTTVNPDPVTYDVHLSTTSTVAGDATTLVGRAVAGSPVFIRATQGGAALTAGTNYWVAIRSKDRDGNGPLSTVAGPVQTAAATGGDVVLTANMMVANHVLAAAIEAEDLNGRVITGAKIQTGTSGNRWVMVDTAGDKNRIKGFANMGGYPGWVEVADDGSRPWLYLRGPALVDAHTRANILLRSPDASGNNYTAEYQATLHDFQGPVTSPSVGCRYYRGSDGSVNTGTATAPLRLAIPSQSWDSGFTGVAAWSVGGTNVWTVPAGMDGRFRIRVAVTFAANATGFRMLLVVLTAAAGTIPTVPTPADASVCASDVRPAATGGDSTVTVASKDTQFMNAGDKLTVWVGQNSGGILSLPWNRYEGSQIEITRIGD